jgi:hypothetical protein
MAIIILWGHYEMWECMQNTWKNHQVFFIRKIFQNDYISLGKALKNVILG